MTVAELNGFVRFTLRCISFPLSLSDDVDLLTLVKN